ncbi:MAG: hypothetical protein NTV62_03155 [Candidatus Gribaldobacteria bacterium]|nr:hypothetical protein [Candidatus Gribaldobacteria bacterium]
MRDKFVKVFKTAQKDFSLDRIIITDIYDVVGREQMDIKKAINSEQLVKDIGEESVIYKSQSKLRKYLAQNLPQDSILVIMGAGDIYKLADQLVS